VHEQHGGHHVRAAHFSRSPGRAVLGVFLIERAHATNTCRKTPRGATPAGHRSGASAPATKQAAGALSARSQPFNPPPRDRADGATLGRPRQQPRRTRRPALRDATCRSFRKRQAPPRPHRLRFREGGRCPPQDPLSLSPLTSRRRNHRLAALPRRPRHDLASSPPLHVTLSGAASEAAQSKGPPRSGCAPLAKKRLVPSGDLSTRSRTHSLKVTWRIDSEGGASPTRHPEHAGLWGSPGRAGHGIVPAISSRPRVALSERGLGAWLSFRREKVPDTAPIAYRVTCDRADGATLGRPRHQPRRTRRPAFRDATFRLLRKERARPRLWWRPHGLTPPPPERILDPDLSELTHP
jgi:hypothetical protein